MGYLTADGDGADRSTAVVLLVWTSIMTVVLVAVVGWPVAERRKSHELMAMTRLHMVPVSHSHMQV